MHSTEVKVAMFLILSVRALNIVFSGDVGGHGRKRSTSYTYKAAVRVQESAKKVLEESTVMLAVAKGRSKRT